MVRFYIFVLLFLIGGDGSAQGQIITTIAGGDSVGLGDGGPATLCELKFPYSTALDAMGNLYIADAGNNRIRKVNLAGIITTIAGNGTPGYGGDDSAATGAMLNEPVGVAVDAAGNVYIADDYNARIRKVNTSGIITTIAGIGVYGYSGDNGPATDAAIYAPHGIIVDSIGNVLFCDPPNHCIRKISPTGIIATIAGNGSQGYSGDGGPASAALLDRPYCLTQDQGGNIFFTEWGNNCVRKIDSHGIITTYAGHSHTTGFSGDGGPATAADFHTPVGIATNRGNVFVSDYYNYRIRKIDAVGIINTIVGNGSPGYSGDGGPATGARLEGATGLSITGDGNLYISDWANFRLRLVNTSFVFITDLSGEQDRLVLYPNPSNGEFYVLLSSQLHTKFKLRIENLLGLIVYEGEVIANENDQILLPLSAGVYYFHIVDSDIPSGKIIIVK